MELTLEEKRWLASLKPFDRGNRNALHAVFALFGEPHTYLDLGCGTGAMVRLAKALGMYAIGVDILPHPEPYFVKHNLKEPLNLQTTFDLITCIETAEHLPEEAADTLCDTLAFHLMGDGVYTSGLLVFTAAAPGQPGDGHLNCVIAGTEVDASGIQAATRRRYDGQVVTIVTRGQNELTVTPNHPVLTELGWLPAGILQKGDYVFSRAPTEWKPLGVMPNNDQVPAVIEEVFSTFAESQQARSLRVPLTAKDFHGDVTDCDVEIVYPNGLGELRTDAELLEPFRKLPIQSRQMTASHLASAGAPDLCFYTVPLSTTGDAHWLRQSTPFGFGKVIHYDLVRFRLGAKFYPSGFEARPDCHIANAETLTDCIGRFPSQVTTCSDINVNGAEEGFRLVADVDSERDKNLARGSVIQMGLNRQLGQGFTGEITRDEIVRVKVSNYRGHVYNLSTASQWYFANHIITHNCKSKEYWREKLGARGIKYDRIATERLARAWEQTQMVKLERNSSTTFQAAAMSVL